MPKLILFFLFIIPILTNKCYNRGSSGSSCASDQECLSGLYCHYEQKKCTILPFKNEPCGNEVYCAKDLGCHANATCQPLAQVGEACMLSSFGYHLCADGLGCYDSKCQTLKTKIGDPCTSNNICGGGLGCHFDNNGSNYCVTKRSTGVSCNNNDVCLESLCDFSKLQCVSRKKSGEECKIGECVENYSCIPSSYYIFFTKNLCKTIPNSVGSVCSDTCTEKLFCK